MGGQRHKWRKGGKGGAVRGKGAGIGGREEREGGGEDSGVVGGRGRWRGVRGWGAGEEL